MLMTSTTAVLFLTFLLHTCEPALGDSETFSLFDGQITCECSQKPSKLSKRSTQYNQNAEQTFLLTGRLSQYYSGDSIVYDRRQHSNPIQQTIRRKQPVDARFGDEGFNDDVQKQVSSNPVTEFSLKLLKNTADEQNKNLVLSPISAQFLLSLLEKGANNKTKKELQSVSLAKGRSDQLYGVLNSDSSGLQSAAGIFHDRNIQINDNYKQKVEGLSKFQAFDFRNRDTKNQINKWASLQTGGHINNLIPENYDLESVQLVLVSAIYFHNTWKFKFEPIGNKEFTTGSRGTVQVPFMEFTQNIPLYEHKINGINCTIINLPYENERYSMVLIVPSSSTSLKDLLNQIHPNSLDEIFASLDETFPRFTRLQMPKFSLKSMESLVEPLKNMGLKDVFGAQSDLSGITRSTNLYVSDILQQATLDVDENGTVAAAATSALLIPLSAGARPIPKTVTIDSPFISIILDQQEKSPIFLSVVNNPAI